MARAASRPPLRRLVRAGITNRDTHPATGDPYELLGTRIVCTTRGPGSEASGILRFGMDGVGLYEVESVAYPMVRSRRRASSLAYFLPSVSRCAAAHSVSLV